MFFLRRQTLTDKVYQLSLRYVAYFYKLIFGGRKKIIIIIIRRNTIRSSLGKGKTLKKRADWTFLVLLGWISSNHGQIRCIYPKITFFGQKWQIPNFQKKGAWHVNFLISDIWTVLIIETGWNSESKLIWPWKMFQGHTIT